MNNPPDAVTIKDHCDSGVMDTSVLKKLSTLLGTDIAVHHRELIGTSTRRKTPHLIQQNRNSGRNTTIASYHESEGNKGFVSQMYKEGYIQTSLSYLMGIQTVTRLPVIRSQQTSSSTYDGFAALEAPYSELSDAPYLEAMLMPSIWTYANLGLATTIGFTLNLPSRLKGKDVYHSPNICFFGAVNRSILITKDFLETVYGLGEILSSLSSEHYDLAKLDNGLLAKKTRARLQIVK